MIVLLLLAASSNSVPRHYPCRPLEGRGTEEIAAAVLDYQTSIGIDPIGGDPKENRDVIVVLSFANSKTVPPFPDAPPLRCGAE